MRTPPEEGTAPAVGPSETIHEIRPWREAGWIFKDGDAYAIERQDDRTHTRTAPVAHERDN